MAIFLGPANDISMALFLRTCLDLASFCDWFESLPDPIRSPLGLLTISAAGLGMFSLRWLAIDSEGEARLDKGSNLLEDGRVTLSKFSCLGEIIDMLILPLRTFRNWLVDCCLSCFSNRSP